MLPLKNIVKTLFQTSLVGYMDSTNTVCYSISNACSPHYLLLQFLDENKSLILKIVESQNSGKLNECAE